MKPCRIFFVLSVLFIVVTSGFPASCGELEEKLLEASLAGNAALVKQVLDQRANIDAVNVKGSTALMLAASNGHAEVVKLLLSKGADVNARNQKGVTALISACFKGHPEVVSLLLREGADPRPATVSGLTAREVAARAGHGQLVSLVDARLLQMAHLVETCMWLPLLVESGDVERFRRHLRPIADQRLRYDGFAAALFTAANRGAVPMMKALMEDREVAPLKKPLKTGAFLAAVSGGRLDLVRTLLQGPDPISLRRYVGRAALLEAAISDRKKVVATLVKKGANVNWADDQGYTAFMAACELGSVSGMRALLAAGINRDARTSDGDTALMLACKEGKPEVVRLLLGQGADLNAKNKAGETPLMIAAALGKTEVVRLLLARRADLDVSVESGATAWSLASTRGHKEIVQLLEAAGASKVAAVSQADITPGEGLIAKCGGGGGRRSGGGVRRGGGGFGGGGLVGISISIGRTGFPGGSQEVDVGDARPTTGWSEVLQQDEHVETAPKPTTRKTTKKTPPPVAPVVQSKPVAPTGPSDPSHHGDTTPTKEDLLASHPGLQTVPIMKSMDPAVTLTPAQQREAELEDKCMPVKMPPEWEAYFVPMNYTPPLNHWLNECVAWGVEQFNRVCGKERRTDVSLLKEILSVLERRKGLRDAACAGADRDKLTGEALKQWNRDDAAREDLARKIKNVKEWIDRLNCKPTTTVAAPGSDKKTGVGTGSDKKTVAGTGSDKKTVGQKPGTDTAGRGPGVGVPQPGADDPLTERKKEIFERWKNARDEFTRRAEYDGWTPEKIERELAKSFEDFWDQYRDRSVDWVETLISGLEKDDRTYNRKKAVYDWWKKERDFFTQQYISQGLPPEVIGEVLADTYEKFWERQRESLERLEEFKASLEKLRKEQFWEPERAQEQLKEAQERYVAEVSRIGTYGNNLVQKEIQRLKKEWPGGLIIPDFAKDPSVKKIQSAQDQALLRAEERYFNEREAALGDEWTKDPETVRAFDKYTKRLFSMDGDG